jgi:iron complex outermembrane receptor protein
VLPSFEAHYAPTEHWSIYAQVAKGFLAPNLNTFYVDSPSLNTLNPETTWNYQAGGTYRIDRLTLSADYYYIDFGNLIQKHGHGAQTSFYNAGGAIYQGFEAEGSVRLAYGFSLYANGSINSAKYKDGSGWVAMTPKSTAAGGLIYEHDRLHASLLSKYVGPQFGDNTGLTASGGSGNVYPIAGYTTTSLSASYTLPRNDRLPAIKISGVIDNLFDKHGHSALAGYSFEGDPFFWVIVPRNYSLSLSAAF